MRIIGMISAREGKSSCFNMKPLAEICSKPMLYICTKQGGRGAVREFIEWIKDKKL